MPVLDFSHLSPEQRLQLIGELWESLDPKEIPLSDEQAEELERRLVTVDEDIKQGRRWEDFREDLRRKYL